MRHHNGGGAVDAYNKWKRVLRKSVCERATLGGELQFHSDLANVIEIRASGMPTKKFTVVADISTMDPKRIKLVLTELVGVNAMLRPDNGWYKDAHRGVARKSFMARSSCYPFNGCAPRLYLAGR